MFLIEIELKTPIACLIFSSFSMKNIFDDKMGFRLFYFRVTLRAMKLPNPLLVV